jgi:hypothetical protein
MKLKYKEVEFWIVITISLVTFVYCVTRITLQEFFQIYW